MAIQETTAVKTATEAEEGAVVDTLVLSFSSDPFMRWFYPTPNEYLRYFPEFVRIYGGKALEHGTAHYVGDYAAAALWLPPGVQPDEDAFVGLLERSLPEDRLEYAWSVLEQIEDCHPDEPFWHLPTIGADPTRQGRGYGSTLMEYALETCDREETVAYLESSNPRNLSLYARYGFDIVGMIQEGAAPPLIPMVREPRG